MTGQRAARRERTLEVEPLGPGRFRFTADLTDRSVGGDHEPPSPTAVIHDFRVTGEVEGPELRITALTVEALTHPYPQCPFILPTCDDLVGACLTSGWRATVLERLRGTAGCTHVVSLLLGLTELTTLTFFLTINESVPYGPEQRADGRWMAIGLAAVPTLAGACHVLAEDGPLLARAHSHGGTGNPDT
ncbi:DUF2889 domain-containing protein [Streptomyces sp. GD-15H]|uniref:DUF2889 domain-containing protein n=1 Tax=Streptomyces sp. GD-15H TaxID=3129112 RepID=UPI00324EE5EB